MADERESKQIYINSNEKGREREVIRSQIYEPDWSRRLWMDASMLEGNISKRIKHPTRNQLGVYLAHDTKCLLNKGELKRKEEKTSSKRRIKESRWETGCGNKYRNGPHGMGCCTRHPYWKRFVF